MTLHLDRTEWRKVRFGEVVRNVNDNVKDPAASGIKRALGLEHLDPGDLHIQRWGDVNPESTFTRRVRPGQTLFGKRRAYQRKTAFAEFDAVCSGDILVFESADSTRLLPELLPFVAMTDAFFAVALETSAGSLSPRTRWTDLAEYEFDLPPLYQQRRIAALLWSVERHRIALAAAEKSLVVMLETLCDDQFSRWLRDGSVPLEEAVELQIGKRISPEARERGGEMKPYVTNVNVRWRSLDLSEVREMPMLPNEMPTYVLRRGDVLACEARDVGRSAVWDAQLPECYYQMSLHRLRSRDGYLTPHLLVEFLAWCSRTGRLRALVGDNLIPHLPEVRLRKLPVPTASISAMASLERRVEHLYEAIECAKQEAASVCKVRESILEAMA